MADTVRPRQNHYETLGVSPTATGDEIAQAFAKEGSVFRPHAFGSLTELCIAYETLRDPIRRRDYDAAVGLKREPSLPNRSLGAREAPTAQPMAMAVAVERNAVTVPPLAAGPQHRPWRQPPFHQKLESIERKSPQQASSGSDSAQQKPAETKRALTLGPCESGKVRPEPHIHRDVTLHHPFEDDRDAEVRPISLRTAGIALSAVVIGACFLGILVGWWSSADINEPPEGDKMVSVSLPPAISLATRDGPAVAVERAPDSPGLRPERPKPSIADTTPVQHELSEPQPVTTEDLSEVLQADAIQIETAADEVPTTATAAATMPLPDRVIARTIERIGYACGRVASTVPVEGEAPGVYKVTCSSGQSYQARPVNGRYRFRRWGRS